ncbi:MAG: cytochrome b/b6 domain-containing protein [Caldilinea sp.]|nr:cytochrome b/b6 domain-containing protein [Caldilinea sp.]MDW8442665.1 cytochrome b/b6 domain-containing protein [Caldilineaceae bacterium]
MNFFRSCENANHSEEKLLRYRVGQRLVHAVLATSFLMLLFSGLMVLWPPLLLWVRSVAPEISPGLIHRIGAVLFVAVPILYLLVDRCGARQLLVESFTYDKDDIEWLKHAWRYFMGHAVGMPPQGRLNAGQKLHHAGVVIFSATVVFSGLALWFGKGYLGPAGLALAATIHGLSMLVLTVLLVGHLYFTFVYKALSAMTTGYVPKEEAMIEHPKWVEELEHQSASGKSF